MSPRLNYGQYIFCTATDRLDISLDDVIMVFKENEAWTYILSKLEADRHQLVYDGVMAWITLEIHSSLSAVGLTAAFATALCNAGISCNVVAAYYHDHIFVPYEDGQKAMDVLTNLSQQY